MRVHQFTRPTIAAAVAILDAHLSQAKFDQMIFRVGLETAIPFDTALSVSKKAALLAREVASRGDIIVPTIEGPVTLAEAIVREAVALTSARSHARQDLQARLVRALALDGFVLLWEETGKGEQPPSLRAALPNAIDLPATDNEVHELLGYFGLPVARGHLDQAIDAHTRGDWAAANSQTRTFLESLFDGIANHIAPDAAASAGTSENRRAMLAKIEFLSVHRNEWSQDGKNYINGLFKMLHTEGSHPGLSDEDRSTFRLHLVLVTARAFLRRLRNHE